MPVASEAVQTELGYPVAAAGSGSGGTNPPAEPKGKVLIAESSAEIPKSAPAKLAISGVLSDPENWWVVATKRWIPKVKGYYVVGFFLQSTVVPAAEASLIEAGPALNGAQLPGQAWGRVAAVANTALSLTGRYVVKMNGTTDFLELFAGNTVAGVTCNSLLNAELIGTG